MNADPRYFENASLLNQIYREAIELAFYGATVIHPKHYNPYKENSLICKVLYQPVVKGTSVSRGVEPYLPCFIVKRNQLLISLSSIDFSFIMEENISEIFSLFHEFKLKVNLIQNTAISFSVCVEDKFDNFNELNAILSKKFKVDFSQNVTLYTIRHFNDSAADTVENGKKWF
jgi:aspartate kinase